MVFVPLSTTAVGTLSNQQIGNASGLYNLLRNIGGSVGISVVNTVIARHQQIRRNEMIGNVSAASPQFQSLFNSIHNVLAVRAQGLTNARSYAFVERLVDQQAALWAYVDDFRWMALACFLCVPVVFLLKGVKARRGAATAAH